MEQNNNTQLPVEVVSYAELKCHNITKDFKDTSHYDAGFNYGYMQGYERAAIEAAHLLYEVFQKHESGLLPDRFIYDKIKKFLYGE